jgi:hypothetical protein
MANCPRCGTADFYPSFSGKGECVTRTCSLYVAPKLPELTPDLSGPQPEASELEQDLAAINWAHPSRSVHPTTTVPGAVPYTPEDSDDYDLTLREVTVAVGILSTYMCGFMPTVAGCRGLAKQLVDNCGIRLHTWSKTMPNMKLQKCEVWFLGARRTLEARSLGTGHLSFIVR